MPQQLTFSNTDLNTPQSHTAKNITLGPNLIISGQGVNFTASETITLGNNLAITGQFSMKVDPSICP